MNEELKKFLLVFDSNGYKAYAVGGYPRDYLLGIYTDDFDICTNALPNEIQDMFQDNIISSDYGSFKIKYFNRIFQVTSFRRDVKYIDNRKPQKIEYIDNLYEDLQRRDFTINTICMDKNGNIIDLLNSQIDLRLGIVKAVGNPYKKMSEDSLRILRAVRFATVLNFRLNGDLYDSIQQNGYLVKKLSYNRKKEELDKIFNSDNVEYGISLLKRLNLDQYLDIDLSNIKITSNIGMWAQINYANYPFSKEEIKKINKINELLNLDLNNYNLYKYGLDISLIVGDIKGINKQFIKSMYNLLPIKDKKDIKISNNDLCRLLNHVDISCVLNDIEYKIIDKKLINSADEILKYIQNTYL